MSDQYDSTIDIANAAPKYIESYGTIATAADISNSRVAIQSGGNTNDLSYRFEEATRKLLRQRLIAASIALASMILLVFTLVIIFDKPTLRQTIFRSVSLLATFGIYTALRNLPEASLSFLRKTEIVLLAIPVVESGVALVFETQRLFLEGRPEEIPTLHATISMAVAVFIAVYAMFIPAKWNRTAIITGCMAIIPTIIALILIATNPELKSVGIPSLASGALLVMIAGVATFGAYIVDSTRKEVESARQYGQYQLREQIGQGGMGVVYKAEHRMLKRPAAIKLIRAESAFDDSAIERFESEVQVSATLSHWNTVQIYDYGRTSGGDFYYVMEHLEGESLRDRLKSAGPLSVSKTLNIIDQLCDGLLEAHQRKMVHRDLKPGNIFLSRVGGRKDVVKILDFGLAIQSAQNDETEGLCGSPPYMSPEQINGGQIDSRSDIYAIGCIIYECLTGRLLFDGENIEQILQKHLEPNVDVSRMIDEAEPYQTVVLGCVADIDKRIGCILELRDVISKIV